MIGKHFSPGNWFEFAYVYYNGGKKQAFPCGQHTFSCTVGVHQMFPDLSKVCTHWFGGPAFSIDEGGICRDPIPG